MKTTKAERDIIRTVSEYNTSIEKGRGFYSINKVILLALLDDADRAEELETRLDDGPCRMRTQPERGQGMCPGCGGFVVCRCNDDKYLGRGKWLSAEEQVRLYV